MKPKGSVGWTFIPGLPERYRFRIPDSVSGYRIVPVFNFCIVMSRNLKLFGYKGRNTYNNDTVN